MILEFFRALLLAALPVGLASYFLFSWALRRRQPGTVISLKQVEKEIKGRIDGLSSVLVHVEPDWEEERP